MARRLSVYSFATPVTDIVASAAGPGPLQVMRFAADATGSSHAVVRQNGGFRVAVAHAWDAHLAFPAASGLGQFCLAHRIASLQVD
jgi:hypothetical protein